MCRAPIGRPVEEEDSSGEDEDSDFDIDEANQGISEVISILFV